MHTTIRLAFLAVLAASCGAPIVKERAFADEILERSPLPADHLEADGRDERSLVAGPHWLGDVRPQAALTFAGLRFDGGHTFALVLECDPATDRLAALPLAPGESPLDVLASPERRAALHAALRRFADGERAPGLIQLSLEEAIAGQRFGPPLPTPRRIFGAAANYPSHLKNDFSADPTPEALAALRASRARAFLKHPVSAPPGYASAASLGHHGVVGPHDGIAYPATIAVPLGPDRSPVQVELRLDYEVELGAVFARELTPETVASATDEELRAAVSAYVLVSDTKSRNGAAATRLLNRGKEPPPEYEPYRPDHRGLEKRIGHWGAEVCTWWSYAASYGDFSALGPFLVAAPEDGSLPPRAMIAARSYASEKRRGLAPPKGREPDVLYLRQCSATTTDDTFEDALVWDVPALVRSILGPDTVVPFPDDDARISPGDVLCLGTPGGAVITSPKIPGFVFKMLFWWTPLKWHDKFFGRQAELFLRQGDQVFYWAEGLGYQLHEVRPVPE